MQKIQRWCDACGKSMGNDSYYELAIVEMNTFITLERDQKYDLCYDCRGIVRQAVSDAIGKIAVNQDTDQADSSKIVWKEGCRIIPQGGK